MTHFALALHGVHRTIYRAGLLGLVGWITVIPAMSQPLPSGRISMTIDEAIQIALVKNYAIQQNRLDVKDAAAKVNEGWGQLLPLVELNSSFTRSIQSINPFSGSQAGGFFSTLGFVDWLSFNEQARTDSDPNSVPISLGEFFDRQQAGLESAGVPVSSGGNPFNIPNQFRNTLSVTQKVFDGRAIWGASGAAKYLKPFNERGLARQEQLLVNRVKQSFYDALLADARAGVASQSVVRTQATLSEVGKRVAQGVTPKFQRLSTEVELANLETDAVRAHNAAAKATDALKLLLGIPVTQPVRLRGDLAAEDPNALVQISLEGAADLAERRRPDLEQARINIELQKIQEKVARAQFLPNLDAFANISYIGNVPDNRLAVLSNPDDPFSFSTQKNGYFSKNYWDWDINVGFRLSWTIFNGLQTHRQIQQRKIATSKAQLQYDELSEQIRLDVDSALRDLKAAQERITSQKRNVSRAELNFSYAGTRLKEGVASPLDVREASDQLDQSRLNYLQAVHDLLVARSAFETAVGMPMASSEHSKFTSN